MLTKHDSVETNDQGTALFPEMHTDIENINLNTVRSFFPITEKRAYLNNASIGALSTPVIASVNRFMENVRDTGRNDYPNWCQYAETQIKGRIAKLIGADSTEIAYVKNTTEGLGFVANGFPWKEGDNVVIADIEYPSNVYCWMKLANRGVELRWAKSENGRITVDALREVMDHRTRIVSLSAVQFSNGFKQDLPKTSALCKEYGAYLNLDGIQWIGALEMNVASMGVDFLSTGGHKWLLAPIGTGFFYCRRELIEMIEPPTVGYHSVDKSEDHMDYELVYRDGASRYEEALVNFTGIWGLDTAVRIQLMLGQHNIEQIILNLTSYAADKLQTIGCEIISPWNINERSGNLAFRHKTLDPDDITSRLRMADIDVAVRGGNVRISPSYFNNKEDIDRLIDELK